MAELLVVNEGRTSFGRKNNGFVTKTFGHFSIVEGITETHKCTSWKKHFIFIFW